MSEETTPTISEFSPGIAVSKRSQFSVLKALVRNPLLALPPEIMREPLVYSRLAGQSRIYIADPVLIHEALVSNASALAKGEDVQRALAPALGLGLLTANGSHWRWQRQSVAGAFRHEKLLAMLPAMIAAAEKRRDLWLTHKTTTIDIGHEMMQTTFDIIVETMMSGPSDLDLIKVERSITDYLKVSGWIFALGILKAPNWVPYPGRRRAKNSSDYLRSSIEAMVKQRRQIDSNREDLVTLLLSAADPETSRQMTDEEVTNNLLTFITAGHETTALGLAWTFHLLAKHPEEEAKVHAEIEEVTRGAKILPEHITKLTYTRQVFSEAMRLYPPAPIISRVVTQDFVLGKYKIPAGAMLYVPVYAVHHHKKNWQNPEHFDPARFSSAEMGSRHRYAYMPFGAGPRSCIGSAFAMMEAVTILAILLRAVRFRNISDELPVPTMKITLRPHQPLHMRLLPLM